MAKMRAYMTGVQRELKSIGHKQELEYTERDEFGNGTKILKVSSCNH